MIVRTIDEATLLTKGESAEEWIFPQCFSDIGYDLFHPILNS